MRRPLEILLVEDDPAHARLMAEVFKESQLENRLHHAKDGEEAMAFLRRDAPYTRAVKPDLILLDLNMPKKDGRETLAEIKDDKHLRRIPVVILTTSKSDEDVLASYNLHANSYVVKPADLTQLTHVVQQIESFWRTCAKLPE